MCRCHGFWFCILGDEPRQNPGKDVNDMLCKRALFHKFMHGVSFWMNAWLTNTRDVTHAELIWSPLHQPWAIVKTLQDSDPCHLGVHGMLLTLLRFVAGSCSARLQWLNWIRAGISTRLLAETHGLVDLDMGSCTTWYGPGGMISIHLIWSDMSTVSMYQSVWNKTKQESTRWNKSITHYPFVAYLQLKSFWYAILPFACVCSIWGAMLEEYCW